MSKSNLVNNTQRNGNDFHSFCLYKSNINSSPCVCSGNCACACKCGGGRPSWKVEQSQQHLNIAGMPKHKLSNLKHELGKHLETNPSDLNARHLLGNINIQSGQYEAALEQFEQILKDSPNDIYVLNGKGTALSLMGRTQEAKEIFKAVLELDPENQYAKEHLPQQVVKAREKLRI